MAPAYAQHRLALQTLQSRQPTERWVLKTPNHLWHLDALLAAYPDARIVWTHRDPGPVVTSLASLANAGQRPLTRRTDPRPTADEWKRKCHFALDSAIAFDEKSRTGSGASTSTTTTSWRTRSRRSAGSTPTYGGEVTDLHARRMRAFLEHRPKDAFGQAPLRPGRLRLELSRVGRGVQGVHGPLRHPVGAQRLIAVSAKPPCLHAPTLPVSEPRCTPIG